MDAVIFSQTAPRAAGQAPPMVRVPGTHSHTLEVLEILASVWKVQRHSSCEEIQTRRVWQHVVLQWLAKLLPLAPWCVGQHLLCFRKR